MPKTILLATIHRLTPGLLTTKELATITHTFSESFLTVSDKTDQQVVAMLSQFDNIHVRVIPAKGAGDARRQVVRFATETSKISDDHYLYCDFDKILVMLAQVPAALPQLIADTSDIPGYCCVERSATAMKSYPWTWTETEKLTNAVAAAYFGLPQLDITSGCAMFSDAALRLINRFSQEPMTDAEWPLICAMHQVPVNRVVTNGIPYSATVDNLERDNQPAALIPRLRLAYQITNSFVSVPERFSSVD